MDFDIRQRFQPFLLKGETVRWVGRPGSGLILRPADAFLIPFSILWCGFAIFWESMVIRSDGAPTFFVLWGIPFVLAGLYFVFGRFIHDIFRRSRTVYALTDKRALILQGTGSLRSIDLKSNASADLKLHAGGKGTINFGGSGQLLFWMADPLGMTAAAKSFLYIDNATHVHQLIQET